MFSVGDGACQSLFWEHWMWWRGDFFEMKTIMKFDKNIIQLKSVVLASSIFFTEIQSSIYSSNIRAFPEIGVTRSPGQPEKDILKMWEKYANDQLKRHHMASLDTKYNEREIVLTNMSLVWL